MFDIKKIFAKFDNKKNMSQLVIIFIIGLILIIYGSGKNKASNTKKADNETKTEQTEYISDKDYQQELERNLEEILSLIKGVGDASVMISFERGSEIFLAYDTKTSESVAGDNSSYNQGAKQTNEDKSVVTVQSGSGVLNPVVTASNYPRASGVIVVAHGADSPEVKADIIAAVSAVVDVPNYKIQVFNK